MVHGLSEEYSIQKWQLDWLLEFDKNYTVFEGKGWKKKLKTILKEMAQTEAPDRMFHMLSLLRFSKVLSDKEILFIINS